MRRGAKRGSAPRGSDSRRPQAPGETLNGIRRNPAGLGAPSVSDSDTGSGVIVIHRHRRKERPWSNG